MGSLIGKITEKLGFLTGDRTEEAKGRIVQAADDDLQAKGSMVAADEDTAAIDALVEERRQVKSDYGELDQDS